MKDKKNYFVLKLKTTKALQKFFFILFLSLFVFFKPQFLNHLFSNPSNQKKIYFPLKSSQASEEKNLNPQKIKPKKNKPFKSYSKQVLRGVHFVEVSDKKKIWELWCQEMSGLQSGKNWFLKKIKLFFFSTKSIEFEVRSEEGQIENTENQKNVLLENSHIQSKNGYQFKTKKLTYKGKAHTLMSESPVEIIGSNHKRHQFKLNANEMKILIDSSKMKFKGKVRGFYVLKKSFLNKNQTLFIQSEALELYSVSKMMKFSKNVKIKIKDLSLETPEAFFHYNRSLNQFTNIKLTHGIKLVHFDKKAFAQTLDIDILKSSLTLKGNIRMIFDNQEVHGEKIILSQNGKNIKILKAEIKTPLKDKNTPVKK